MDGKFCQAEMTSCGLNGSPLNGTGHYPSYIACNVYGKKGTRFLSMLKHPKAGHPYLTQKGGDRESGEDQYVAHMCDGAVAGYKYFNLSETKEIRINICGNARGTVYIRTRENDNPVAEIPVKASRERKGFSVKLAGLGKKEALFFCYEGKGSFDFHSFDLK